jgi:hypothetical protein
MFKTSHRSRRFCLIHNPKKSRSEYDRARKLIIQPPTVAAIEAIPPACHRAASDVTLLQKALHHLPTAAAALNGLEKSGNFEAALRFMIQRLDVLDYPGTEDELVLHLMHPAELAELLFKYEAHANASTPHPGKRGPKTRLDPELLREIRGVKPNQKSCQAVADILARDHHIFVTRQAVHEALK